MKITQQQIDVYVATTEDYWKEFHNSLSAPFHPWNDFKNQSLKKWINICRSDSNMLPYLNLLFEYPVLKGEFLLSYSDAMLLTNYRLIMNNSSTGIINIPLNDIEFYGKKEFGDNFFDKETKDVVQYLKNGKQITLEWTSIEEEIVNNAIARNRSENFEPEQLYILENSVFELKKHNSEIKIPKIEIPDQQDTSIILKEKIENLTEDQVDKYIADTETFWKEFHKSLNDSISIWNQHKEVSFNEWINMCWNNKEMIEYFNLLFQFPLLKGEFPIGYSSGMVLTNYRLVINDNSKNILSIPLTKIKEYGPGGIIIIENQTEKLSYQSFIKPTIVKNAISRCKNEGLNEIQEKLITNSLSDLKKEFSDVSIPKIEMFPLTEEQKVVKEKFEKSENRKGILRKVIGSVIIIFIIIGGVSILSGGNRNVNDDYVGNWSGSWEGSILNELNGGSAYMTIESNGDADLTINSGTYGTKEHTGYVDNDYFIITSGSGGDKKCAIVNQRSGFKVVLIWPGVNMEAYLN